MRQIWVNVTLLEVLMSKLEETMREIDNEGKIFGVLLMRILVGV
jgi:hypothetical protein